MVVSVQNKGEVEIRKTTAHGYYMGIHGPGLTGRDHLCGV